MEEGRFPLVRGEISKATRPTRTEVTNNGISRQGTTVDKRYKIKVENRRV